MGLHELIWQGSVPIVKALTLDQAQKNLPDAVQKALRGEDVTIKVGSEVV